VRARHPSIADEIMATAGVTYRQLDHWTTRGYLRADEPSPGSGNHRTWSPAEIGVAVEIQRLTGAGLSLPTAAAVARRIVTNDETSIELGPGVFVDVERVS
jgi:DNA-binding transcriptional MerR regulator